jgi:hypothetical protein
MQRKLQVEAFDLDPAELEGAQLGEYVTWNAFALEDELHELMQEVQWKPWANDRGTIKDHDACVREFVDVMHFLGNIALALRLEASEIDREYGRKLKVNLERQRQPGGYDVLGGSKCRHCGRDLEDVGVKRIKMALEDMILEVVNCGACDEEISRTEIRPASLQDSVTPP